MILHPPCCCVDFGDGCRVPKKPLFFTGNDGVNDVGPFRLDWFVSNFYPWRGGWAGAFTFDNVANVMSGTDGSCAGIKGPGTRNVIIRLECDTPHPGEGMYSYQRTWNSALTFNAHGVIKHDPGIFGWDATNSPTLSPVFTTGLGGCVPTLVHTYGSWFSVASCDPFVLAISGFGSLTGALTF